PPPPPAPEPGPPQQRGPGDRCGGLCDGPTGPPPPTRHGGGSHPATPKPPDRKADDTRGPCQVLPCACQPEPVSDDGPPEPVNLCPIPDAVCASSTLGAGGAVEHPRSEGLDAKAVLLALAAAAAATLASNEETVREL